MQYQESYRSSDSSDINNNVNKEQSVPLNKNNRIKNKYKKIINEIEIKELSEPNLPNLIFKLVYIKGRKYLTVYYNKKRIGAVRIRDNLIKSLIAFIIFIKNSINYDISIDLAKTIYLKFGNPINVENEVIEKLLLKKKIFKNIKYNIPFTTVSKTEDILAEHLKKLKIPFKRQVLIGNYVVDFLIEPNIIIEVEGLVHYRKYVEKKDQRKVNFLEAQGYEVYRLYSKNIIENPKSMAKFVYDMWRKRKDK
jgi:Uncharacterized protein conserved in bacteria